MRLFIAMPLPKPVEDELGRIIFLLKQKGGSVKWVAPKNIHVTVRFLGDTEENLVGSINERIDTIARDYSAVATTLHGLGAFPNPNRPRVIWAGLDRNIDTLAEIASKMEVAMRGLGFAPEERGFKPHVTLGRVRENAGLAGLTAYLKSYQMNPLDFTLDRLLLFRSTLTPKGPIYDRLHEALLGQ
jgi:2'-5' RNA ligase